MTSSNGRPPSLWIRSASVSPDEALHHEVRTPVVERPQVVHLANVRVPDGAGRARFLMKALHRRLLPRLRRVQHLRPPRCGRAPYSRLRRRRPFPLRRGCERTRYLLPIVLPMRSRFALRGTRGRRGAPRAGAPGGGFGVGTLRGVRRGAGPARFALGGDRSSFERRRSIALPVAGQKVTSMSWGRPQ